MSDHEKSSATFKTTESSAPSTPTEPIFDDVSDKKLLRKVDWHVIPPLWALFLISFIDRGNIGNAKIQGMTKSLHLVKNKYNMAVMVFTLAYVVCGVPANIAFRKFGPKLLSVMMFCWGLCVIGQGVTQSWAGLVACRLLMGICESGFVPGSAFIFASYYKKHEFLRRYAIFFSAMLCAGAFNGLLAYAIANMDGTAGYEGWRWIFIIEGLITIVFSVASFWMIVPLPEKSSFLQPKEKEQLLARLAADGATTSDGDRFEFIQYAKDWKIWLAILAYMGAEEGASSVVAFQPTILKSLGYTSAEAQIHSIPIYVVAFVVCLSCAWASDLLRQRYIFGMVGMLISLIGWSIQVAGLKDANIRYMGMFFLTAGCYVTMPVVVVWFANLSPSSAKRNVGLAAVVALGNCGAFVSSNVFITEEAPKYPTGFKTGLGFCVMSMAAMTALFVGLMMQNSRKAKLNQSDSEAFSGRPQDLPESHPAFRYQL